MLEAGALAPDFTLKDQAGQPVSLRSLRDDRDVLLVFFPLAFTAICQGELAQIQENLDTFQNADVQTLAISVGPPPTHKVWATQNGFTFPVLSDFWPHGEVASAYGVFDDASGYPNRGTFAVDTGGVIVFADMKSPGELREESVWTDALKALRTG